MKQKLYIGSDHAGISFKEVLKTYLSSREDISIDEVEVPGVSSPNYAQVGHRMAEVLSQVHGSRGILICGTGIGIAMAANRHAGVRAAVCHDVYTAECARTHNDANVIALGARVMDVEVAKNCVDVFLKTDFEGGRHIERVEAIDTI